MHLEPRPPLRRLTLHATRAVFPAVRHTRGRRRLATRHRARLGAVFAPVAVRAPAVVAAPLRDPGVWAGGHEGGPLKVGPVEWRGH